MKEYQERILAKLYTLGIEELCSVKTLNLLGGDYINLECSLPNGKIGKILDDNKLYLANQVEENGTDKCFGIAADENQIAVFKYGCDGVDAELIMWVKL